MALRMAGQPERTELSYAMLKTTDRDRGGEHGKPAARDERQREPARDHRAGKVAVTHKQHVA